MKPTRSLLLKVLIVGVVYALLDLLSAFPSLRLALDLEAVWLPCGFLFAVLVRSPKREWPWLLGIGTLAGFTVNYFQSLTPLSALTFALSNPAEVIAGSFIVTKLLNGRQMNLRRVPDALILGLAAVVDASVSGVSGVIATRLSGVPMQAPFAAAVWAGSALLSHLFIAPLILAWPEQGARRKRLIAESILWMVAGAALTRWGLHGGIPDGVSGLLMFLPFPLLVAAALRTGPWGLSIAFGAVAFTALVEGAHGHGPLPIRFLTPDLMLVWMQLFLATEAVSLLVLACASEAQRLTEGSLLESESRYRALIEQFPDAILLREGSRIRYANPAAVTLFGVNDSSALEGRSIKEFLLRGDATSGEHSKSDIHRYTPALRERTLRTETQADIPVEVTDISVSLPNKGVLTMEVFRDLSKRRAAEKALQRSEQDFQRFFDMAPMPLVLSSTEDSQVLRANPLAIAMFEAEAADLSSMKASDFYVREQERQHLREALFGSGRVDGIEIDVLTHKGRLRRVLASAALVTYGGKDAILAGFMDVTLRMKTEEALRQTQKLESLGLMAGGVAHDFNNLLTALIGNMDLARMSLGEDGPAEPFFEAMATTMRRAGDLARQMLAYAGQAQVEVRPVNLNDSIRELTGLLAASMSKKIELRLQLDENLPLLEGDPVQLQQVFLNLITNAADAIGTHEGVISVSSRAIQEEGAEAMAEVEVRDSGAGMSPEVRARIFDPFFTTKASGRGLGLSTLLGILKAHRATITVESAPGQGSCFKIRFPVPAMSSLVKPSTSTGPFSMNPMEGLVLMVDDEADIRMTAGSQLRRLGLEVIEAGDGREALSEVERHGGRLRLIILDLSMPRMDGAEALSRIREQHPGLPVILSSGFDPSQRMPELLKQPKTWFLPKPYRLSDLRKLVGEVLQED
ncbi:MAG: response regulator [Acidobacteria bacterium]|nr:response regulator [Acidobacteriota bacterium]